jgi:hypothetical protein
LSLTGTLLSLALGAQAAPAPATPAVVTFDTTPRAGQHQRQLIDVQATVKMRAEPGPDATEAQRAQIAQAAERMAQMGPMQMAMQMQQTVKVGQPDADGWLPMTVSSSTKPGQLTVGGKTVPLPQQPNRDLSFTSRFNPQDFNFEMQKTEGSSELSAMLMAQGNSMIKEALQLSKALSQRPMKVGDSVDVPLNMALPVPLPGGAGQMGGQVHYTLTRVDRGVAYFDLTMDMKMDIKAPVPAVAASAAPAASAAEPADAAASAPATPQTMNVAIQGSGKGISSLRLVDRLPLNNKLAMTMQLTMNMPDNGLMNMDMDMVMSSKGESLAKVAPAKAAPKKKS